MARLPHARLRWKGFRIAAAILLLAGSGIGARADTIVLTDGRSFNDAQIVSQSPMTVTVRHAAGFVQIQKSLLPEALRAKYPADPAAAAAAAQQEKERREAEARQKQEAAEKKVAAPAEPAEPAKEPPAVPAVSDAEVAARAKSTAHDRALSAAYDHFYKWRPSYESIRIDSLQLKIDTLDQRPAGSGPWTFTGSGSISYHDYVERRGASGNAVRELGRPHLALVAFEGTTKTGGETTLTPRIVRLMDASTLAPK